MMEEERLEGKEGLREIFERILRNREGLLRSALTDVPLVYLAGEGFADDFMKRRCAQDIHLRSLRFTTNAVDAPKHQDYEKFKKEARVLEENLEHPLLIWDDTVAIVTYTPLSVLVISDPVHSQKMKKWFDGCWERAA